MHNQLNDSQWKEQMQGNAKGMFIKAKNLHNQLKDAQ